jgi:hypothetical protein
MCSGNTWDSKSNRVNTRSTSSLSVFSVAISEKAKAKGAFPPFVYLLNVSSQCKRKQKIGIKKRRQEGANMHVKVGLNQE